MGLKASEQPGHEDQKVRDGKNPEEDEHHNADRFLVLLVLFVLLDAFLLFTDARVGLDRDGFLADTAVLVRWNLATSLRQPLFHLKL